MSAWKEAVEGANYAKSLTIACFCMVAALTLASLFGISSVRWPTVVFTLLGAHALTAYFAFRRIAQLQASLDMKRMTLGYGTLQAKGQLVQPGDVLDFSCVKIKFHDRARIEVI